MLLSKQKKAQNNGKGKNRILITVNVVGSAGPLRFVVNEEEIVASVIDMALKSYAREGRLPVLGSDLNDFLLYCPLIGSDEIAITSWQNILSISIAGVSWDMARMPMDKISQALNSFDVIGAHGARNFMLCKRPQSENATNVEKHAAGVARKGNGSWKSWINKTLSLKIASH